MSASSSFTLSRHPARQIVGFADVFGEVVELPDVRIFHVRLETSNQFPVALVDRHRGNQVRKPSEVCLSFEPTGLFQNRNDRFAVHDVTGRRLRTDGFENGWIQVDWTDDRIV